MASLLKKEQVGKGLEVSDAKLVVKAGNGIIVDNGGVAIDTDALPVVPKAVADISIAGTTVTKSFTDGTSSTETLPAPTVDVKLSGLTFKDDKLEATLSDGSKVETEFGAEIVVATIEAMDDAQKGKVVAALLPQILESIKGEEATDFGNNQIGYFIKKDA